MVPAQQMAGYVSAQVYSLRYFSTATSQSADHWGFAWAPRNASGMSAGDFASQTGQILDRLGAAIRDSGQTVDPEDPGSAACGPPGQNIWCAGDLDGARFNEAWKSFRVWTQPVLTFATPPQTIPAGTASSAMSLALLNSSGQPLTSPRSARRHAELELPAREFSTSPTGPWSTNLALTIAAGTSTSGVFYYLDTRAGSPLLTASAQGADERHADRNSHARVRGFGFGNPTVGDRSHPIHGSALGRRQGLVREHAGRVRDVVSDAADHWQDLAENGTHDHLTTFRKTGEATVTARVSSGAGTVSGTATLHVRPDRLRIPSITYRSRAGSALVTVKAVDSAGRPIIPCPHIRPRATGRSALPSPGESATGAAGKTVFRVPLRASGCFRTSIRSVSAPGFVWDGRTPRNRFCRQRSP